LSVQRNGGRCEPYRIFSQNTKSRSHVLCLRNKEQVLLLEFGWYRAKSVPAYIAGALFLFIRTNNFRRNYQMKFIEKLRMQATFAQILNEKEINEVQRNYYYRPYQNY